MKSLLTFFTLFIAFYCQAEKLTGIVIDENDDPIYYATVALYAVVDSSLVNAASTEEDGTFSLQIDKGDYYIIVSYLGYQDMVRDIVFPLDSKDYILKLEQDRTMLATIEIKDKAPLLEQRADKLIVNVEGNITNTSGSLLDVMKKVPGMLVVRDRLSMVGSGSPTILLNGKTTQYMDVQSLLRDMPGDNIQKVEIIHQPGAEYEATGSGPIINIIMKKNSLFGTNGSVTAGATYARQWEYITGLNLSHYAGKLNISGGAGFSRNGNFEILSLTRRLNGISEELDGIYDQVGNDVSRPLTYRGNVRVDYDLDFRHRVGMEAKHYNNDNNWQIFNTTIIDFYRDDSPPFEIVTTNDRESGWQYSSLNPYYIFEIDTMGQKLELDLNYAKYKLQGMSILTSGINLDTSPEVLRYNQPGDTDIYVASVDYTKPINNIFELRVGAKYSQANLDNNLIADSFLDNNWESVPSQTNHYLFDEEIIAAYGKLSWVKGAWAGTAGLRYESSESVGNSLTLDTMLFRDINKLFPSFSLSRELGKVLKSTLSYSRRINRPNYSTLNPFVYYLDPYTSERGNPNLQPELTHSAKFTLSYEGQPFFNVEYRHTDDAIVEVTEQDTKSEEAFKTDINFDTRTNFSTSLFFPLSFIPGVDGFGGVILNKVNFDSEYIGDLFLTSQWNTTAFIQAQFELPGEIQAELGGWYTSANQEGIFISDYLYGTSFGISKKFLNRKLKVNIGVEDFVNKFWSARVDYQQDMDILLKWATPQIGMRVSYKFGNQHLKSKTKKKSSASDVLNRASQG